MGSIWQETVEMPRFEALDGDVKAEVLVIGGGMAGLLCAHELSCAGVDVTVVEAGRICGGVTGNTTAKITSQHGIIYEKLIRRYGEERARAYFCANEEAIGRYRELCRGIACDFEEKDAFVYSTVDRAKIERETKALERIGGRATFCETRSLPIPTVGAVKLAGQAQFHPLKFAADIAGGFKIFEHTKVRELVGNTAVTAGGRIRAEYVIVATHFPFLNKHGWYFLKMYQHRSYVLALRQAADVGGMYVDESDRGLSFRNTGDLLLLGGGGHRTGKQGGGWQELEETARRYDPGAQIVCRYATQDCMTLDGVPYIGAYAKSTPRLLVATGFNKWGMTSSMVAARVLCDRVLGKPNEYAQVFDPSRSIWHPQLAVNAGEAVMGWLTPTARRCPHLGCALKWNPHERTWDCSCHGSRFTREGEVIDNPATGDLKRRP